MPKPDLQLLDYLAQKGVRFTIQDGSNYWVGREEIEEYLDDPEALFASFNGVTKFEYRDWREAGGSIQCAATTRKGKQCSNLVKTGYRRLEAQEWVARQGEFCTVHSEGTSSAMRGLTVRAS